MPTLFTKIIEGEIPAHILFEDKRHIAFLDIRPIAEGHTLVVPKEEIDYVFDMKNENFCDLFLFAKRVALGVKKVVECKRIGMLALGLEIPHVHLHLVPLQNEEQIDLSLTRMNLQRGEIDLLAKKIKESINSFM